MLWQKCNDGNAAAVVVMWLLWQQRDGGFGNNAMVALQLLWQQHLTTIESALPPQRLNNGPHRQQQRGCCVGNALLWQ